MIENRTNINWYPGHMAKTKREMAERLSSVDLVAEILDARIPGASRNGMLDELTKGKQRLLVLNRADLADPAGTRAWAEYYRSKGFGVVTCDAKSGAGVKSFLPAAHRMLEEKYRKLAEKGQTGRKLTCMVIGIPNVGKSSFINKLAGRKAAKTEDRPGVTRDMKLIPLDTGLSLLDTPGALRDDVLDVETLASNLILTLADVMPEGLYSRYKVRKTDAETGYDLLELAARRRGFLISGGEGDTERVARILLDEFRGGKLGKVTLEKPDEGDDEEK